MFASHWQLALLATVISPLNWLIVRRAGVVQGMYGIVQQETMARANGAAVEALSAMRTVQANTGELASGGGSRSGSATSCASCRDRAHADDGHLLADGARESA